VNRVCRPSVLAASMANEQRCRKVELSVSDDMKVSCASMTRRAMELNRSLESFFLLGI